MCRLFCTLFKKAWFGFWVRHAHARNAESLCEQACRRVLTSVATILDFFFHLCVRENSKNILWLSTIPFRLEPAKHGDEHSRIYLRLWGNKPSDLKIGLLCRYISSRTKDMQTVGLQSCVVVLQKGKRRLIQRFNAR